MTGKLTGNAGSIWVWAAEQPHYKQSKQFAVMDGGTYSGLNVFRNARTDTDTENPLQGNPLYLYGISRSDDSNVYWSGGANLTITKTITGGFADFTAKFPFTVTVTGLSENYQCDYARETYNGSEWVQDTGAGATGKLTVGSDGKLSASSGTPLSLGNNQRIVISIPRGVTVVVSEANGYYTASYGITTVGSSTSTTGTGNTTSGTVIAMNTDTTVAFRNHLDPPSPTGLRFSVMPYALMLAAGLFLFLVVLGRKRKEKE